MTYAQAVEAIAALEPRGWRLCLDRMWEFCRRAGLEDALGAPGGPQFIHVAGTNGKGSTTAFVESILVAHGYHTGGFYSPYVVDYRERFQLDGHLIPKELLAQLTQELLPIGESLAETDFGGVTKFEFEAGLGFLFWKRSKCDWVALEVGLGGRLDATNVVTPRCSVIVSIGLDHVSILGDTLSRIAVEKAGIIKPGIPVVVGEMEPGALEAIEQRAMECQSEIWRFGQEIRLEDGWSVVTPAGRHDGLMPSLEGVMQPHNMALAVASLDAAGVPLNDTFLAKGVREAFAPGRFQLVRYQGSQVVLDGAHNRDAGVALLRSIDKRFGNRPWRLVTNMLSGHDPLEFYELFRGRVRSVDLAPIDFVRATPVDVAAKLLEGMLPNIRTHASSLEAYQTACNEAASDDLVVVTGSNYLVGDILRAIRD
ncbi:MAG TPA: folylpolyglutamate synthase/dihydrofolate synthase family protein [Fimbriimonas sp.]|nr:folylpolyglutamate synthase/dihydrofolate synthase family protein [Fimbriimonas sp.]